MEWKAYIPLKHILTNLLLSSVGQVIKEGRNQETQGPQRSQEAVDCKLLCALLKIRFLGCCRRVVACLLSLRWKGGGRGVWQVLDDLEDLLRSIASESFGQKFAEPFTLSWENCYFLYRSGFRGTGVGVVWWWCRSLMQIFWVNWVFCVIFFKLLSLGRGCKQTRTNNTQRYATRSLPIL
jgi:hypothetical protein